MLIFRHLRACLVTAIFSATVCIVFFPIVVLAVLKLIVPLRGWRALCNRCLDWCASQWMTLNTWQQQRLLPTRIKVEGLDKLSRYEWYMLIANHQSWVDILVILRLFNGRIPYVKFFLKQSLIWIPLMGIAFWALDFPFMRRHTKAQIERNPSLKDRDMERTRRSCEKFRDNPVTIINFLEGTRRTPAKYAAQRSPYRHLLLPKAGGLAFTLAAMNGQLHRLLDVSIFYPGGIPSYWEYASGGVDEIRVHVRQVAITPDRLGDYVGDAAFRQDFQRWVNELWEAKDRQLDAMNTEATGRVQPTFPE